MVANFDLNTNLDCPKILASNHPNSFFDAIVIAVHYPKPIYFLARGDAFKNKMIAKFLKSIHLIPIFRLSEGKENLSKNDKTFKTCLELLQKKETILIFSEGICVNEWKLRNLKKGTARLALMAVNNNIDSLVVQPVNINYSSFSKNPKEISLHFNEEIQIKSLQNNTENNFYRNFNLKLKDGIEKNMVLKEDANDIALFAKKKNYLKILILTIPAFIGFTSQFWWYLFFKSQAVKKTKNTVFYDSVLFGMLLLFYPLIVLLLAVFLGIVINVSVAIVVFIGLPFTSWSYKEFKSSW